MDKHIRYFDSLRLFASLAVIMLHILINEWWDHILTSDWHVINVFFTTTRFAVPIFFMISGAIFLDPTREIKIKSLYTKNIARILIAYGLWTIIYSISRAILDDLDRVEIAHTLLNGQYHLWFLPSLVALYILVPALRPIAKDKTALFYFTGLYCIGTFFFFSAGYFDLMGDLGLIVRWIEGKFYVGYVQGDLAYFLLGYCLYAYDVPVWVRKMSLPLAIFFTVLIVLFVVQYVSMTGYLEHRAFAYSSMLVAFQTVFIFIFFKYHHQQIIPAERIQRIINRLTPYLFGVYLAHDLFLMIFRKLGLHALTFNPLIGMPLIMILTFICSLALTYLIKQIPVLNKYLV